MKIKPDLFLFIGLLWLITITLMTVARYNEIDKVPVHWNIEGKADRWVSKDIGVFLFPMAVIIIGILYYIIPMIDPLGKNIDSFRKEYEYFFIILISGMTFFGISVLMGEYIDISIALLVSSIIFASGLLIKNSKRSWFIGFRTPWTLSDEQIWETTNKSIGNFLMITGIVAIIAFFSGYDWMLIILMGLGFSLVYGLIYSFSAWKIKNMKAKERKLSK